MPAVVAEPDCLAIPNGDAEAFVPLVLPPCAALWAGRAVISDKSIYNNSLFSKLLFGGQKECPISRARSLFRSDALP